MPTSGHVQGAFLKYTPPDKKITNEQKYSPFATMLHNPAVCWEVEGGVI